MGYKKFRTLDSFLKVNEILAKYEVDPYTSFQNFALFSSHNKVERYLVVYDLIKRSLYAEGDVIEFGIWNGNNTVFISKILSILKSEKKVFGIDHFKGLAKEDFTDFIEVSGLLIYDPYTISKIFFWLNALTTFFKTSLWL